ncbi:cytochrome c family protein [Microbaculum marinisediminis]|uniref:c-type cytochrome n=1 Tax=Microbaculum marinisediminis TaxID=2931392 RepID=UPI0028F70923|nr:cytochrome c family protein [Microbaculum sp. A6E488]
MIRRIVLAAAAAAVLALPAHADGDAEKGEKVFKKCRACHEIGEGAKNKVGPELNGVIGRTAGTGADFKYSDAMVEAGAGGLVWNDDTLEEYLSKPRDFIPKNKMAFAGLKKEDEIEDVIAYLEQYSQ